MEAPSLEMISTLGLGRAARVRAAIWRAVKYGALVALAAAVVVGVQRARRPAAAPSYRSAEVSRGDLRVVVAATGRVQAATTVEVGAEVSGRIERLLVEADARVSRGQLLAVIDDEQLAAALAQQQAQLASARATVRQASASVTELEQSSRRITALADQALAARETVEGSQAGLARARAAHDVALANTELAVAGVKAARSRLAKATIRSPIDGVVLARNVEPGQTVNAGFATPVLFKLAEDLTRMRVEVDIDEADIGRVRAGNPATFTVDAYPGREFSSRVVRLSNEPTVTQNVVTYRAELEADNHDLVLRPGMTATATIVTEVRRDVPMVANAALRFMPDGARSTPVAPGHARLWLAAGVTVAGLGAVPMAVEVAIGATDGVNTELRGAAPAIATPVLVDTAEGAVSPAPLLELVDVTRRYGAGETLVTALAGANLQIDDGEFVAVMGPSGSGKSTCLNVLGGLDRPTSGTYWFRGVDVGALSRDQLARFRRHYLGFVFQGFNLLARTTALENVELPLVYRGVGRGARRAQAVRALAEVGLSERADHTPAELSGGQQQRVAIARAIVTQPALLLADEPTGNLDSARKDEIMRLLVGLNRDRGITIVMVTHEPEMATYASRVVHFRDGLIERDERRAA